MKLLWWLGSFVAVSLFLAASPASAGLSSSNKRTSLTGIARLDPAGMDHHRRIHPTSPSSLLLPNSVEEEEENGNNHQQHHQEECHSSSCDETSQLSELASSTRGGALAVGKRKAVAPPPKDTALTKELLNRLKIGFYFALWYALNIVYNIVNKKLLNVLPAPLTVGSIQFGIGAWYVSILWLLRLRSKPKLAGPAARQAIRTVGFWHCAGQLFSMVSLGAGPVSFTHIVKALEPFFSALVSALYFGKWMHPTVYATLIPVVGGVAYACLKEKSFSWLAFGTAMGSNVAFALRAVLSKMAMTSAASTGDENTIGTNISPANMFGLVTFAAFWISIPLALAAEGNMFYVPPPAMDGSVSLSMWDVAVEASEQGATGLVRSIIVSGLFHYLNNEVMYLALGNVHPVTLAVGNTMKRVFIMVASVMVFRNQISLQAGIGSAVGIFGVLLYSLTKQHYEALEKEKVAKSKHGHRGFKMPAKKAPAPKRNSPPKKPTPAKRNPPSSPRSRTGAKR